MYNINMQLTKREHACLDIQLEQSRLIIDPGIFTKPLNDYSKITTVVITHEHPDHYDQEKIQQILAENPNVKIFCTAKVAESIADPRTQVVRAGDSIAAGNFKLDFFGEKHATIAQQIEPIDNVGVLINDKLFYPGDALTQIDKPYEVLALPINAPWTKLSEVIDYIVNSPARIVFPTHNGLLNQNGLNVYYSYPKQICGQNNKQMIILDNQQAFTI